jgi:cytochrome c-type biogenesis protein CcmH/NrfG
MNREVARLRDEIALREASMADAAKEHATGELTVTEFEAITQREESALERVRRELSDCDEAEPVAARRRIRRTRWLVVALICFAIVLGYALFSSTSPRQVGNSGDGSITLTQSQLIARLLTEGEAEVADGQVVTALNAYQKVLTLDPKNVTALTETGWLDFTAGSAAKKATVVELGIKDLEKAIAVAPRNAAPRLYFAIVADATPGNQKVATTEFREFLRLNPSVGQMAIAEPFLKKLGLAHK